MQWHQRLGHPGPDALEHLVNCSEGVRLQGPSTVQYNACGTSKIKRQMRRKLRTFYEGPAERLAIDFYDYEEGLGDYSSLMLITDRWSGFIWDYYLQDCTALSIIAAIDSLFKILSRQYKVTPKVVECDNEIMQVKPQVSAWLVDKGIRIEPSAPQTQEQNGGAERSGGVIKEKSQAMRASTKFPRF